MRKETIAAVTPANQKSSKREQKLSKKKRAEQKRTMDQYFGPGKRVPPPSKGGTPVQSILMQRLAKVATGAVSGKQIQKQKDKEDEGNKTNARGEIDGATGNDLGPNTRPHKDIQDDDGKGSEALEMEVDLDNFSTGLRPKGQRSKKKETERSAEKATGKQGKQSGARKSKIVFAKAAKTKADTSPMRGRLHNQN